MASSMLSSATIVSSPAQATMVAPFTGLKSFASFPMIRKGNTDITSITSNGGRVNCMQVIHISYTKNKLMVFNSEFYKTNIVLMIGKEQVWPPIGKKKFETLSYLPDLTDVKLAKEVDYIIRNKWTPCVEFEVEVKKLEK